MIVAPKEKGRREGSPNPKYVLADNSEHTALQLRLQVSTLVRRLGVEPDTAVTLAPMVFGVLT